MKVKCPTCKSENLDQGLDKKIICHDCRNYCIIVAQWVDPRELEKLT